jgi:hypothetical protein
MCCAQSAGGQWILSHADLMLRQDHFQEIRVPYQPK